MPVRRLAGHSVRNGGLVDHLHELRVATGRAFRRVERPRIVGTDDHEHLGRQLVARHEAGESRLQQGLVAVSRDRDRERARGLRAHRAVAVNGGEARLCSNAA